MKAPRTSRRQFLGAMGPAAALSASRVALAGPSPRAAMVGPGYLAYLPGPMMPFWHALREPAGRIVLAGEHTDTGRGT